MNNRHRLTWNEIQQYQKDQPNTMLELIERFGPVAELNMMGVNLTFVADPDMIQKLLIKHAQHLHRDPFTFRVFRRMVGDGVFIAEGETWRKKRKLIQPIFHAAHIHDFADAFAKQAKDMVQSWQVGDSIQIEEEMMGLALRIICETMFGTKIDALVPKISQLMREIMQQAEAQLRPPVPDWFPTLGMWQQRKSVKQLRALLLDIIHQRQNDIAQGKTIEPDLLTMLLTAVDEDGNPLSDVEVLDECLTIFVAGHETTAVAMSWTWMLLLQHPDILDRLKRDIEHNLGDAPISFERLAEIPYLAQVVKESLRLYPPAHGFGRTPTESFTIDGHQFNKGDIVIISTYALHRQERFYSNPLVFDPDRFAPDREQPPRYAFIPFGAGSRTCIGNAFAMLEMQVILATMLQQVELSLEPNQEFEPVMEVTLRPENGVRVQVEKQKEPSAQKMENALNLMTNIE